MQAKEDSDKGSVAVAQLGARRHYLVPIALHRAGRLEIFLTDNYLGRRMSLLLRAAGQLTNAASLQRLAGRRCDTLPDQKVVSFNVFGLLYKWRVARSPTKHGHVRAWLWAGRTFGQLVVRHGFGSAAGVYAYSSAACEILERGKRDGIFCILDHATAPRAAETRLAEQERQRYPGWFPSSSDNSDPDAEREYNERQRREWALADLIICNSTFVARMIERDGGPLEKTVVLPLGVASCERCPQKVPRQISESRKLKVLFAGDEAARKGLGDALTACRMAGVSSDCFRIAGDVQVTERMRRELESSATLLGRVPREKMAELYSWADVLILPTLSDTFGLVVLEAMMCGAPAIVTANAGVSDMIRDGQNGFVVPVLDPECLADRLKLLAGDRDLRASLSRNAYETANEYIIDKYEHRLVEEIGTRMDSR